MFYNINDTHCVKYPSNYIDQIRQWMANQTCRKERYQHKKVECITDVMRYDYLPTPFLVNRSCNQIDQRCIMCSFKDHWHMYTMLCVIWFYSHYCSEKMMGSAGRDARAWDQL